MYLQQNKYKNEHFKKAEWKSLKNMYQTQGLPRPL